MKTKNHREEGVNCGVSVRGFLCMCMTSLFIIAGMATISWAQNGTVECDDGKFAQLKSTYDSVVTKIEFLDQDVFGGENRAKPLGQRLESLGGGKSKMLTNVKNVGIRGKNKTDEGSFKKFAKLKARGHKELKGDCPFAVLPGTDANGNGICDPLPEKEYDGVTGELCEAVEQDCDDTTCVSLACNPYKKGKRKGDINDWMTLECEVVCNLEDAVTLDECDQMEAEADILLESFEALDQDLGEMNIQLSDLNMELTNELLARAVLAAADSAETCPEPPELPNGLETATKALRITAVTTRAAASLADTGCDQVAVALGFGGNGKVVCAIAEGVAMAAEIAYAVTDEILNDKLSDIQDAVNQCVKQVSDQVKESADSMDEGFQNLYNQHAGLTAGHETIRAEAIAHKEEIMNKLEAVRVEVMEKLERIDNLLNTPEGCRPEWPLKECGHKGKGLLNW